MFHWVMVIFIRILFFFYIQDILLLPDYRWCLFTHLFGDQFEA